MSLKCYRCGDWNAERQLCACSDGQTIFHGDCREVLPLLPTESVDHICTDPPYGMDLQPQRGNTKAIAGDVKRDAKSLWWATVPLLYRVQRNDRASVFYGRWSEEWAKSVLSEWYIVKGCVCWVKDNWGIGFYLRPQWELAWYVHKGTPKVPEAAVSDVWDFRKVYQQVHSCEKPVALLKRSVEVCGEGEVVLDPFLGSGTTLRACKDLGRRGIGIEISEEYCQIAVERLKQEVLPFA